MEKLPRRRPSGHQERTQQVKVNIPGLIVDYAVQQVDNFIGDLLDALDGITHGLFNLDGLAVRFRGTESRLDREVVRLDNRIDTMADELGVIQIATFGFSGPWQKPPGAYGDIVFDIIAGASGGGRSNNGGSGGAQRGGLGGWSGGWQRVVIPAAECPAFLDMIVGGPAAGASSDGGNGTTGKTSEIRDRRGNLIGQATGGSSVDRKYGDGNNTFRMRGGNGGAYGNDGTNGSAGTFDPGGKGGVGYGSIGENGFSIPEAKIGVGSGAGGGASASSFGNGPHGGDGGWPSGPGGGGGAYVSFGVAGNGGIGSAGAIYASTRINSARTTPPSAPTNLVASAITRSGATITWTASTDDTRVTEYEVLVDGAVVGYIDTPSYTLAGRPPATAHVVKIRAVDENGNWSAFSTPLTFTTLA